jgi:TolB-like protein
MPHRNGGSAVVRPGNALSPPLPDEVRAQLSRILASHEFVVPERVRSFLRYLVEQTLTGHADRLKGYTIATAVFERGEGFDAQADPVVRTEAGRLRRALERYYLVEGQADPVLIEVPKGCYVPIFERRNPLPAEPAAVAKVPATPATIPGTAGRTRWRSATIVLAGLTLLAALVGLSVARLGPQRAVTPEAALPESPTILVSSFESLSEGDEATLYAAGVTEEILTRLSGFKDIAVLGRPAERSDTASADELAARYRLTGSLRLSASEVRVTSRLVDGGTNTVLWAQTYAVDRRAAGLFAIQGDIAQRVASAVAQPYGAVFRSELQRLADQAPEDLDAYGCTLRFHVYRAEPRPESHALIRDCLERAVAHYPGYATAWAMLSLIALDEDRFHFNPMPGAPGPIERALRAARRSIDLDADNARGLQALMMALFFDRQVAEAGRVGELALAVNPHDSDLLSEFGLRIAMAGAWQRGRELVERALARDPAYSGYYHAVLALIAYMQDDVARAEAEIRQAKLSDFSLHHGVAAIIYAECGHMEEARREAALFMKTHPTFIANLDAELSKRNLRPDDHARLVRGLVKAGLPVPAEAAAAATRLPGAS